MKHMFFRSLALALAFALCLTLIGCNTASSGSSGISQAFSAAGSESSQAEASQPESSAAASSKPESVPTEALTARVGALKGPTAMGMVKLMDDMQLLDSISPFQFTIAAAADEITPKLVQGELDLAAIPANLASVLYNNTQGQIQVLAVNTLGVLYIMESGNTVQSVEDLRGKTIYASGKGSTPEYALNYMLSQNGIDPETDVTIEWKSEHSECVAALAAKENTIAMLPQPFATTAQMKNETIRQALDMTAEWEKLAAQSGDPVTLITGVVVGRTEFIEQNPELVKTFLSAYQDSIDYVNSETDAAAALVGEFDIVPEAVAKTALPKCNITYLAGDEMKEKLSAYLQTLFDQNPKSMGGAMPGDDFYYAG